MPASKIKWENSGKTQFQCSGIDDKHMFSYTWTMTINKIIALRFAEMYVPDVCYCISQDPLSHR